jgi:hypothetical protein
MDWKNSTPVTALDKRLLIPLKDWVYKHHVIRKWFIRELAGPNIWEAI